MKGTEVHYERYKYKYERYKYTLMTLEVSTTNKIHGKFKNLCLHIQYVSPLHLHLLVFSFRIHQIGQARACEYSPKSS